MTYIHGFNEIEQARLVSQAKVLEDMIFKKIDYSDSKNILEIGCGVGAQTEILLNKYPNAHITGIELSEVQLNTAKAYLNSKYDSSRFTLLQMNAEELSFDENTFDAVYICWVLEHVPNPQKIVGECFRVLNTRGQITITEVQNNNLYLVPQSDVIDNYWRKYNELQIEMGGNPYVGVELGNYLFNAKFNQVKTYSNNFLFDNNSPEQRTKMINYWTQLLLSGFDGLLNLNKVKAEDKQNLIDDLHKVRAHNGVFHYSCIQSFGKKS